MKTTTKCTKKIFAKLAMLITLFLSVFIFTFPIGFGASLNLDNFTYKDSLAVEDEAGTTSTFSASGDTITIKAKTKASSGCGSTTYTPQEGRYRIKNTTSNSIIFSAKLTFSDSSKDAKCYYSLDDGITKIAITSNESSLTHLIGTSNNIYFEIKSGTSDDMENVLSITNINITTEKNVTVKVYSALNGSVFVDDIEVTQEFKDFTKISTSVYKFKAVPNENYGFLGWYNDDGTLLNENEIFEAFFEKDYIIYPRFYLKTLAVFSVNNKKYDNLHNAINEANNSDNKIITLVESGSLETNEIYQLKDLTFLIPYDNYFKPRTQEDGTPMIGNSQISKDAYLDLIVPSGTVLQFDNCKLFVEGLISNTQGQNGCPQGKYGHIELKSGSKITLNNSILYAYGFITGEGTIEAKNNSIVYEPFQITDFRGGRFTLGLIGNNKKVFPFNQYYIQNIECSLRIYSSSKEIVYTVLGMIGSTQIVAVEFIGSKGMFVIDNPSSYVEKKYDPLTDYQCYDVYGDIKLQNIIVTLSSEIDSADYVLPLNNNIKIVSHKGTITINQDFAMLPGAHLEITKDSNLKFLNGKNLICYNKNEWGKYCFHSGITEIATVPFSYSNKTKKIRDFSSLGETVINLNGTITVNGGSGIYTTNSLINFYSSEKTGRVEFVDTPVNLTETYQVVQDSSSATSSNYKKISIQKFKLKNGTSHVPITYFDSSNVQNGQCVYFDIPTDEWKIETLIAKEYTITFDDGLGYNRIDKKYTVGEDFTFPTEKELGFLNEDKIILEWDIAGVIYKPGETIKMPDFGDIVANAKWSGWFTKNGQWYYSNNKGELAKGLVKLTDRLDGKIKIHKFSDEGMFESTFTGPYKHTDNEIYYIENGFVLENCGLKKAADDLTSKSLSYYYFGNSNHAYKNGTHYISENMNGLLSPGYYTFDENGKIVKEDPNPNYDGLPHIVDGICFIDGIRVPFGLFEENGYYYYADENGKIVKESTYYVTKLNGLTVVPIGLYYFDSDGRLCGGNLVPISKGA